MVLASGLHVVSAASPLASWLLVHLELCYCSACGVSTIYILSKSYSEDFESVETHQCLEANWVQHQEKDSVWALGITVLFLFFVVVVVNNFKKAL